MSARASERPIIFSGPEVRAILEGRKTQTRRVVKLRRGQEIEHGAVFSATDPFRILNPFGQPGDRLWVQETWNVDEIGEDTWMGGLENWGPFRRIPKLRVPGCMLRYAANYSMLDDDDVWRPSIHMPRWASRLTLEVTGVRVERLQEISEEDALADGGWTYATCPYHKAPVKSFADLWDKINGKRHPWESNAWVWAIEFRPLVVNF